MFQTFSGVGSNSKQLIFVQTKKNEQNTRRYVYRSDGPKIQLDETARRNKTELRRLMEIFKAEVETNWISYVGYVLVSKGQSFGCSSLCNTASSTIWNVRMFIGNRHAKGRSCDDISAHSSLQAVWLLLPPRYWLIQRSRKQFKCGAGKRCYGIAKGSLISSMVVMLLWHDKR